MRGDRPQPWLLSARADGWFILAPPFAATLIAAGLTVGGIGQEVSPWAWAALVIGIDVAHVDATLFRTYLNPTQLRQRSTLYLLVPICAWAGGVLLYTIDALIFWRALAYLAVFHFVRQQYGLMMIYARGEPIAQRWRRLDAMTIYLAAVYPLVYWHTHLPREFHWFVSGDFAALPALLEPLTRVLYLVTMLVYGIKELVEARTHGGINWPKNLVVAGTAISWLVGIVLLNGDLAFTLTNVVAHGIPYLALVWMQEHNSVPRRRGRLFASGRWVPAFVAILIALAYLEEGLWDGLIWSEHGDLFAPFQLLPTIAGSSAMAVVVPLLAVPQITHYVLDGFIWRLRGRHSQLFQNGSSAEGSRAIGARAKSETRRFQQQREMRLYE